MKESVVISLSFSSYRCVMAAVAVCCISKHRLFRHIIGAKEDVSGEDESKVAYFSTGLWTTSTGSHALPLCPFCSVPRSSHPPDPRPMSSLVLKKLDRSSLQPRRGRSCCRGLLELKWTWIFSVSPAAATSVGETRWATKSWWPESGSVASGGSGNARTSDLVGARGSHTLPAHLSEVFLSLIFFFLSLLQSLPRTLSSATSSRLILSGRSLLPSLTSHRKKNPGKAAGVEHWYSQGMSHTGNRLRLMNSKTHTLWQRHPLYTADFCFGKLYEIYMSRWAHL